jgi:hypothetical protein
MSRAATILTALRRDVVKHYANRRLHEGTVVVHIYASPKTLVEIGDAVLNANYTLDLGDGQISPVRILNGKRLPQIILRSDSRLQDHHLYVSRLTAGDWELSFVSAETHAVLTTIKYNDDLIKIHQGSPEETR